MSWQASIVLEHGAPLMDSPAAAGESVAVLRPGAGWYRGDLHLHTVHSDGRYRPDELIAAAHAAGLDFIVSTEHNTNSANRAWPASRTGDLLVIAGEEVTTRHGHWLAVGLPANGSVDWRYGPRYGVFGRFAEQVRTGGGLVVAAHPAAPLPGSAWEFGYRDVDALEVWNGNRNVDDEVSLRIWHRLLCQGRRVAAVGGSDSHGPHQRVGRPQTVVKASELSARGLTAGLRLGRCYVAESSAVTMQLTASGGDSTRVITIGPGETLAVGPAEPVTIDATVAGAPGTSLALITADGCVGRITIDGSGSGRLRWPTEGAEARFARVEVRRRARVLDPMVAFSNPVWLTEALPAAC